jgi:iron complex outermembrane receptor protein
MQEILLWASLVLVVIFLPNVATAQGPVSGMDAAPVVAESRSATLNESTLTFDIQAQPLSGALADFEKISGVNVIYRDRLVEGKKSSGMLGKYSPEAALKRLLDSTDLTYQVTAKNTVVLKKNEMVTAQSGSEEVITPKKEEGKSREAYKLKSITVTAQKREENVQDVPASISVFSDMEIEDADIRDVSELTRFTPNAYKTHIAAGNIVVFRGISTYDTSIYSPAGFYVDGVNYPLSLMHNPDFFDIERIEVLKGPQGTLYGRNSESGVVNIITKQPDNHFMARVFGEYGAFDVSGNNPDSFRTGGTVSGPVQKDKLYIRLSGQWEDSDGFVKNVYKDTDDALRIDHKNGRATLRWTPSEQWDISLIGDYMDEEDGMGFFRFFTGPDQTDRHEIAYDERTYWENEGNGQVLRTQYEGKGFNFFSVTGRRYYESRRGMDFDCTPVPLGKNVFLFEDTLLSQEIRISSPQDNGPFQWLFGLYAFDEDNDVDFEMQRTNQKMQQMRRTEMDISGWAVFGQGTYTLFDRLHLTAGMRYDCQDMEGKQRITGVTGTREYSRDLDYDELLPKFSIACDLTDTMMSYATVSKGYLAGGYSYNFATGPENFTYDAEYTWNYELGLKTTWLDNRLRANLSVFYIDIEDKQVTEYVPGMMGVMKINNAAEAHSQGVELEVQASTPIGLDLIAGVGYMDTEIDKWTATEALGQYDYSGKDLPYAPEYTYNLGAQYRMACGFFGRVDLLGMGDFYFDTKNNLKQSDYQIVNLRMGYESRHYDIILWAKNVFDEKYAERNIDWGGEQLGKDGAPRMFGVKATYRF